MRLLPLMFIAAGFGLTSGCRHAAAPPGPVSPHDAAVAANQLFLGQKTYDPWILSTTDTHEPIPAYCCQGRLSHILGPACQVIGRWEAGHYHNGQLVGGINNTPYPASYIHKDAYRMTLDMHTGVISATGLGVELATSSMGCSSNLNDIQMQRWPGFWQTSDVKITGDPQAQQVTHANLFYLLSSTYPGSDHSIPPMGLSSNVYGGHIFWDAEVWMLPALLPQHPDYAKSIVDYRFKRLAQARRNAKLHGFAGAEFPWESADTGAEVAPQEFAQERHITADVAWAAWNYYLWTGDNAYLRTEAWPLLRETANYWASRVTPAADGQYHINKVLSPDETAGVVNDDAWTNAVAAYNLTAATRAAALLHQPASPKWAQISTHLARPYDKVQGIPQENSKPLTPRFAAKQADTLLLLHPLGVPIDAKTQGRMLDYYSAHTIANGPAMTASIHAIVAARLGHAQQSLDDFRASYQPFERGPWDAFSEKRTTSNVYFLTGMAGCVQSVLYGFAGLQVVEPGQRGQGTRVAGDSVASLYADPHLPPGWTGLTVQGVRFRGHTFDVAITAGSRVKVTEYTGHGSGKP